MAARARRHERDRRGPKGVLLGLVVCALGAAPAARAAEGFVFADAPIHPGCVHAVTMRSGDRIPVATAVSLEGCAASERTRARPQRDAADRDFLFFEDEILLGEGSFGYRVLARLENGVYVLGIRRTDGTGVVRASLAAVDLVERPGLRDGQVVQQKVLETIGEVWLQNIEAAGFRAAGNIVQYTDGVGPSRVERTIDLSRIARARRK